MCSFIEILGDINYSVENLPDCLLINNLKFLLLFQKFYSIMILFSFLSFIIHKLITKGRTYFGNLSENSFFVLLDNYYLIIYEGNAESLLFKPENDEPNLFGLLYFCFFLDKVIKPLFGAISKLFFPLEKIFWKYSRHLLYHVVVFGFFIFTPLQYVFSFLLSQCLESDVALGMYCILDVVTSTAAFFVLIFMISFISARRELLSLHIKDIKGRAFLFHYHFKKAQIFSIFFFFIKMLLMAISERVFLNISLDSVSKVFYLGQGIFFLLMIRRSHSRKRIQINCNCAFLKEESKYFQIHNFMYKHRPNFTKLMVFEKDEAKFFNGFENNLKNFMKTKWSLFKRMIDLIDAQKFNKIMVKQNVDSNYHSSLAVIFLFYFAFLNVMEGINILTINDFETITNSCLAYSFPIFGYILTDIIEIFIFPYFFYKALQDNSRKHLN